MLKKINDEEINNVMKTLEILVKEVFKALRSGKSFVISASVDSDLSITPMLIGLLGGSPEGMNKISDSFSKNNYNLLMEIQRINKINQEKKKEGILVHKKDDGSIIINFNK